MPLSVLSGSVILDSISPGSGPRHMLYLQSANALLPGMHTLATATLDSEDSFILIAGFAVEVALKALLSYDRVPEQVLKSKGMGHNLPALWKASFERGLLPNSAPPWISSLNEFHDFPYFIRYKSSIAFYSLPARTLLLKNVSDLIALTNSHVTR